MRIRKEWIIAVSILAAVGNIRAQTRIEADNHRWGWDLAADGTAQRLLFFAADGRTVDTIPFFTGKPTDGPAFYLRDKETRKDSLAPWTPIREGVYRSAPVDGVVCKLEYLTATENPTLRVTLHNVGNATVQPEKAGIKLGLDIYMDSYPEWFSKYFPTLMRNEKTHFWGYFQTPGGRVLGVVCPQPVASWSVDFSMGYQDPAPHWFWGHRIESVNLDLLNALPLPERHPQDLWQLKRGAEKTWDISFLDLSSPDEVEPAVTRAAGVPTLVFGKTSYRPDERVRFDLYTEVTEQGARRPEVKVRNAEGEEIAVYVRHQGNGHYLAEPFQLPKPGLYTVTASAGGKTAEGVLSALYPWSWYMDKARDGALKYHQKASSHIESWMGFYTAFLAAKDFPKDSIDTALRDRFEFLFDLLHDTVKMEPKYYASRIQNTAGTIGMLVDKYQAYGDLNDLDRAARLADWMIGSSQREDGAYYNHGTIYTSVIYIAKSILELAEAERPLAVGASGDRQLWRERFARHFVSAKRAVDQLVAARGNFQTEGEHTFEDGMISCSALQMGMLALALPKEDTALRRHYTEAMLDILNSHDCLTQLRVPDARRRGGTMRFWEAQYDVQMLPNMFNSPHGWSAWRGYATYYAYLLTGEERWLHETFNAMGAFANLIDPRTGDLSWAFISDPYVQAEQACGADTTVTFEMATFGNPHPRLYPTRKLTIGEQYVGMISDWQPVNTQDNDVHEVFKMIGEAALEHAFVVERKDGSLGGYNCQVTRRGRKLIVVPTEPQIRRVHFNVKQPVDVTIDQNGRIVNAQAAPMQWVELPATPVAVTR